MALLDSIKSALTSVDFTNVVGGAVGSQIDDAKSAVSDTAKKIEKGVDEAVVAAKWYAAANLTLQAIAAFSAFGMLMVQIKQMKGKRSSGTSGYATSANPRRRKRRNGLGEKYAEQTKRESKQRLDAIMRAGEARHKRDLLSLIRPGDRVTIVDRFGKKRTGRAVMRGPYGWVLNLGGAHGTPGIADNENIWHVKQK